MSDHVQIIVKVAERCNLDCSYCYMYSAGDQSWRERPALLSAELRTQLVERCAEFLAVDPARRVTLEFHGGEPLLLGKGPFRQLLTDIRAALGSDRVFLCLQTNATLLDDEWCALFEEYALSWSISCDGPPKIHDRFRLYHSGAPSSAAVERGIRLSLSREQARFGGVLAVVDPSTSGPDIVRYFHGLGVRDFDLLLPDASHLARPGHLPSFSMDALRTFLIEAFDAWIACRDPDFRIRLFEHMIRGLFGLRSGLDAFGGDLWGMLVVESDGSYQLLDVLRIHGVEQVETGLDLVRHSLDDYLQHTRGQTPPASATCKACPIFNVCGGGYLPHRYDGHDYDRPSIYCSVLYDLIAHIHTYLRGVTPPEMWQPIVSPNAGEPGAPELAPDCPAHCGITSRSSPPGYQ